jgi:ATP/maltotriose-dependent transcriptional regulator MalT
MVKKSFNVRASFALSLPGAPRRRSKLIVETGVATEFDLRWIPTLPFPKEVRGGIAPAANERWVPLLWEFPAPEHPKEDLVESARKFLEASRLLLSAGQAADAASYANKAREIGEEVSANDLVAEASMDLAEEAIRQGRDSEGALELSRVPEKSGQEGDSMWTRRAYLQALLAHRAGNVEAALALYQGVTESEDPLSARLRSLAGLVLGRHLGTRGLWKEAMHKLRKSSEDARLAGEQDTALTAASLLGEVLAREGVLKEAEPWLRQVVAAARNDAASLRAHLILGQAALRERRKAAEPHFRRAIEMEAGADARLRALARLGLAETIYNSPVEQGREAERAEELVGLFEQARELARECKDSEIEVATHLGEGAARHRIARYVDARAAAERALEGAHRAELPSLQGYALYNLAAADLAEGKPDDARRGLASAVAVTSGTHWPLLPDALLALAKLCSPQAKDVEGRKAVAGAADIAREGAKEKGTHHARGGATRLDAAVPFPAVAPKVLTAQNLGNPPPPPPERPADPRPKDEILGDVAARLLEAGRILLPTYRKADGTVAVERSRGIAREAGAKWIANEAAIELAEAAAREKGLSRAREILESSDQIAEIEEAEGVVPRRHFLMGVLEHHGGRPAEAAQRFAKALEAAGTAFPEISSRCGLILAEDALAEEDIKRASELLLRAHADARTVKVQEIAALSAFRLGRLYQREGLGREAEPWLQQVAKTGRKDAVELEASFLLGCAMLAEGRQGAELFFESAIELEELAEPRARPLSRLGYLCALDLSGKLTGERREGERSLEETARRAAEQAAEAGDRATECAARFALAAVARVKGMSDETKSIYAQVAELARGAGLLSVEAYCSYNLAAIALGENRPQDARRALDIATSHAGGTDWPLLPQALFALGTLCLEQDMPAEARRALERAVKAARTEGDSRLAADVCFVLSSFHIGRGDSRAAKRLLGEAITQAARTDYKEGLANALCLRGMNLMDSDREGALVVFQRAQETAKACGKQDALANATLLKALCLLRLERTKDALPGLADALNEANNAGQLKIASTAALVRAALLEKSKDNKEADKALRWAIALATKTGENEKVVEAYRRLADLAGTEGDKASRLRAFASVIEVATRAELWDDVAEAHIARAQTLAELKRGAPAKAEKEKALSFAEKVQDVELKARLASLGGSREQGG